MILQKRFFAKIIFTLFFLFSVTAQLAAQSGIYVGGHFRRERSHTITDLKASGFTYVILFNVNVETNGDLTVDGETICTNGTYVFGNTSPNYAGDVAALKQGTTSINRTEYCIGGWGNHSYANIRNLINSQGTGTGSILYRNFKALKNAIPSVDAINNDDEESYDVNSATSFHVMMSDIGYRTTLAPYTNRNYWQNLATNVNNQRGGAVDKIYLQWYEGGAGNNPCDWRLNNIEMHTGDLYYENATTANDKMNSAKNNCGSKGGFFWVYNDNNINLKELAGRVNAIYPVKPPIPPTTDVVTAYNDCNYTGFSGGLKPGDYSMAQLAAIGIQNDQISSMKIAQGFKAILYYDDNFTGATVELNSDNGCFNDFWNDKVTSIKILTNGVTNVAGTYYLQNRNSGLNLDVRGGTGALNDGATLQQWNVATTTNQQFRFDHLGDGTYKITAVHSGKVMDVSAISKDNGADVQQWTYANSPNQQFIVVASDNGFYKLIAKHSGKVVEVAGFSKSLEANVQQWDNVNQTSGQWKFNPAQMVIGNGDGLLGSYYNGMNFETVRLYRKDASINFNWNNGTPDAKVNADQFSVRWTGQIQPKYSGVYTFYVKSDNGRRLWINGQLLVDKWIDNWDVEYTATINLTAGQKYDFKMEYFENNGGANAKLEWSSALNAREVIPTSQLYAPTIPTNPNTDGSNSNVAPTASITSPSNGTSLNAPSSIDITANASATDGTISKVEFYNGTIKLGEDATSPYSYTWTNVGAGSYNISAKAFDNDGAGKNSASVNVTVKAVVTDACSGVAVYVENGNYSPGSKVKNVNKRYECKEFPYSGWCNGAAWAYAPGTGAYWTDAWYERGACNAKSGESEHVAANESALISPNPTSGVLTIHLDIDSKVSVYNSQGIELISDRPVSVQGYLDISELSSGIYLIKIEIGSEVLTHRVIKN